MKTFLLIDASALIYRFFYALPPLTDAHSNQIQGIYGLANVLLKILREQRPDYAAAALDRPEKTFREAQFQEYKIHRPPVPDPLVFQLKMMPELFGVFNIKTFEKTGFEADDIIGTLAENFVSVPDLKIIILSGDLDVLQLVKDKKIIGQIIKSGLADTVFYDEAKVEERYELKPARLPDYKALVGDASDNIPGVKGIGPKTAQELLKEFGNLEKIFEDLVIIPAKVARKLTGKKDAAFMYRELATIKRNVPLALPELEALLLAPPVKEELISYFKNLGFMSLVKRIE